MFRYFIIGGLIFASIITFVKSASADNPQSVGLVNDGSSKNLVFVNPDGKKVEIDNFFQLVRKYTSSNSDLNSVISFLVDLKQDGNLEIISQVHFSGQKNEILILDDTGKLLANKDSGAGEELVFGLQKKGFPVFFGYETEWGVSAGAASWEFDFWDGTNIKSAVETDQWIGKGGPGIEPHFIYLPEEDTLEIISDDGKMLWNKNEMKFIKPWKPLGEKELLEGCSNQDQSLSYLNRGKKYFHEHEYNCAVQEYKLELLNHPDDYSTWQYLGYAYLKEGESEAAKNALERSIQIKPDYVMGHYNLALAYFAESGVENAAVSQIKKVIELNPAYEKVIKKDPQFKEILQSQTYINWENQQMR